MANYGIGVTAASEAKADAALRLARAVEEVVDAAASCLEADGRYYTAVERSKARAREMAPMGERMAG